jgi:hypothetical protein
MKACTSVIRKRDKAALKTLCNSSVLFVRNKILGGFLKINMVVLCICTKAYSMNYESWWSGPRKYLMVLWYKPKLYKILPWQRRLCGRGKSSQRDRKKLSVLPLPPETEASMNWDSVCDAMQNLGESEPSIYPNLSSSFGLMKQNGQNKVCWKQIEVSR